MACIVCRIWPWYLACYVLQTCVSDLILAIFLNACLLNTPTLFTTWPNKLIAPDNHIMHNSLSQLQGAALIVCSKKCQAVITMIAQKLGNEDAALYRFTHPTPPTPPAKSHPQVAFFNTVVERDPSAKNPSQTASNSHKDSSPSATQKTMQRAGDHKASPKPSSSQSASKPSAGVGSLSHHPRKQTMPPQQYAAGNAKVPIMLAEIKVNTPLHILWYKLSVLPSATDACCSTLLSTKSRAPMQCS